MYDNTIGVINIHNTFYIRVCIGVYVYYPSVLYMYIYIYIVILFYFGGVIS